MQAPDTVRVSDIPYLRTLSGWRYLAVVMDAATRHIAGWRLPSDRDLSPAQYERHLSSRGETA